MSDRSQGPGWWLASDGRWYPPDQAPPVPPPDTWAAPPAGPPPSSGLPTGAKVALALVAGLVGLIVLAVLALTFLGTESESRFESTGTAIGGDDDEDDEDGGAAPAVDLPDGYALIEGDGVSIAAPEQWEEVDPDDFAMTDEEFEAAFPDAPPGFLDQASAAFEQGATLVAFDLDDRFSSNVNIASFPGEAPLSMLEAQATTQLETLDGDVVSSDPVEVPAGDAVRLEYTIPVTLPDGDVVPANGVQFYVVADGRTHVVTITTVGAVADLADSMIETFRTG